MIRALIVDDEAPARRRLAKLLSSDSGDRVEVVAEAADGKEALSLLEDEAVDVLFLDIQMPELNGFEVLERLDPSSRPIVIFTTAYDSYALKAFEENAVDYLLKPISRERLQQAVDRVERMKSTKEQAVLDDRMSHLLDWLEREETPSRAPSRTETLRQISVPFRDRILLIPVQDLISAEIHDGITRLYVRDVKPELPRPKVRQHVVNYTLDELEGKLDENDFMRVHRSALVQLSEIRELIPWFSGRYKLIMTGEHEVIASRDRSRLLKERLML
ncbi:MAG: LytR/AlgR family response regulator transcription factor [Bacteroidota bacterium]